MYFFCSSPNGNGRVLLRPPTTKVGRLTFESARPFFSEVFFGGSHVEIVWNIRSFQWNRGCLSVYLELWLLYSIYTFVIGSSLVYPICSRSFFGKRIFKEVSTHVGLKDLGGPLFCFKNRAQTSLRKRLGRRRCVFKCSWCWVVWLNLIHQQKKLNVPRFV